MTGLLTSFSQIPNSSESAKPSSVRGLKKDETVNQTRLASSVLLGIVYHKAGVPMPGSIGLSDGPGRAWVSSGRAGIVAARFGPDMPDVEDFVFKAVILPKTLIRTYNEDMYSFSHCEMI